MREMFITLALVLGLTAISTTVRAEDLRARANEVFEPVPKSVPELGDDAATREKVELGRMLFFDPRLSASGIISCSTCHNLGMGGDDSLPTSVGHRWQRGPRNAPTVLNAVFNVAQFWDGRAPDLEAQAKGPVQAGVEMANVPENVVVTLKSLPEYVERFAAAFPGEDDPTTFDNMARAIASFEATLTTPGSRFDQYLEGNEKALTVEEKGGLALFMDKGCTACHNGVNVGGNAYFPFGLVKKPGATILPPEDKGRFAVTKSEADTYVFRVAPLRNVAVTAPYFHSGQVWDLKQAVTVMASAQLGADLTDEEAESITAFLQTLTGEQPRVEVPILPVETADTPRPQL